MAAASSAQEPLASGAHDVHDRTSCGLKTVSEAAVGEAVHLAAGRLDNISCIREDELSSEEQGRRQAWSSATAVYSKLPGDGDGLEILGHQVMESWEEPYMAALASAACGPGGRVLEVGFGMGFSAGFIDSYGPSVVEHVIFEANDQVLGKAALWADSAQRPTTVLGGFWQDLVEDYEDCSFGGVLFDAFPLSAEEASGDGEVGAFFEHAARLLRPGGCFTFYFDAGNNWIQCVRAFRGETTAKLLAAGFSRVEEDQVMCPPREGCPYFWKDRFVVPFAIK